MSDSRDELQQLPLPCPLVYFNAVITFTILIFMTIFVTCFKVLFINLFRST
jgi:hypothetical protein